MEQKYFMHRIQNEGGNFTKGIEVHDTMDSAILSFWGRIKTGYNNPSYPNLDYVSCKITDINGGVIDSYNLTWKRTGVDLPDKYFMHHIKLDGETFSKDIDICDSFDQARFTFAAAREYGYDNPKFPNVALVSCEVTDINGAVMRPFAKSWKIPEEEPTPPEQQQAEA